MGVTGREIRVAEGGIHRRLGRPGSGHPCSTPGSGSTPCPTTPASMPGCWPSSPGTWPSPPRCAPHPASGRTRPIARCRRRINAIAISLHGAVRADRWMLYHHLSTFAGDGMTHAECRVHDEEGTLLASFTVDAMVRAFRNRRPRCRRAERAVSLTTGRGPLSASPGGRLVHRHRRDAGLRGAVSPTCAGASRTGGHVVDSERVLLVHRARCATLLRLPDGGRRRPRRARAAGRRVRPGALGRRRRVVRGGRAGLHAPAQPLPPCGLRAPPRRLRVEIEGTVRGGHRRHARRLRDVAGTASVRRPPTPARPTSWPRAARRPTAPTRARPRTGRQRRRPVEVPRRRGLLLRGDPAAPASTSAW